MSDVDGVIVLNLRDVYVGAGRHEFKIAVDRRTVEDPRKVAVRLVDSRGEEIAVERRVWGQKLTCAFALDEGVAEGVATVVVSCPGAILHPGRFTFWVIR